MRFFRTEARVPFYNESRMPRTREPMPTPPSQERGDCRGEPLGTYRTPARDGMRERPCAMNEDALMRKIQELSFVAVELELYLDAYPDCTAALESYRRTTAELSALTQRYEEQFGPLVASSSHGDRWTWTMGKWPWHTDDWR